MKRNPMRSRAKKWTFEPAETADGETIASADILDPQGKSIFTEDLGEFFGISTKTAERIVALLNHPIKPKGGKGR